MTAQLVVGGTWLASLSQWGELAWSHAADGGCLGASWKMDLPPTYSHPSLRRGQVVEIKAGPSNLWKGTLAEIDPDDDWTFTSEGLSKLSRNFICFDASLNTTATPDVAVDQAIARGIGWTRPASISNVPFAATDATAAINKVGDLLDAYSTANSKRWGVNAQGQVTMATDPIVPTYHLTPGSGRFGLADDDYASDLFIRYLASGTGYATATAADATARANWGRVEFPVDATKQGIITPAKAVSIGTGLLAQGKARQGYTNAVTVSKYQLTTPGGTPACLPFVKAGDLARMFGVLNEQGQPTGYVDFVIGETHYEDGSDMIGLAPVGLVGRTLAEITAELYGDAA